MSKNKCLLKKRKRLKTRTKMFKKRMTIEILRIQMQSVKLKT